MNPVTLEPGPSPIVLAQPHAGTWLPADVCDALNDNGRLLADTDWHIDRLYQDLLPDATVVRANFHRYLIDANRAPDGHSLYPGQNTTGLIPLTDFDGRPIWKPGQEPPQTAIAERLQKYHGPYHEVLSEQLERVRQQHGIVLLFDCHSIRSVIPFLFEGKLPDLNLGTNLGQSCDATLSQIAVETSQTSAYTYVLNGRFRGGWTTRHYGKPELGQHAIQMELSQTNYLKTESPPFAYDQDAARSLRHYLRQLLENLTNQVLKLKV